MTHSERWDKLDDWLAKERSDQERGSFTEPGDHDDGSYARGREDLLQELEVFLNTLGPVTRND